MTNIAQKSILSNFSLNYKDILIDEIALEGLEGIGLNLLWTRMEKRISSEVTEKMKHRFWVYVRSNTNVSFYMLPEPLPHVEILDRFSIVHAESGHLLQPDDYPDGPYEYCPVKNEYGSCKYYSTRILKPQSELRNMSYEDVVKEYGDTLVIVATIEERWHSLAGHRPISYLSLLSPMRYAILELVGRARENGQMTIGLTNLSKLISDSKSLYYNRKSLQRLDFIRVSQITQVMGKKAGKCLLLRLKRFHQPSVLTMPKSGALHNIIDYLSERPAYSERLDVLMRIGLLTSKLSKALQRTINIFKFEEKLILHKEKSTKKKIMSLSCESDESSQSDDESNEAPLKCEYKVGVTLLRQAYEMFLNAGLKGLTQVQIAQLLGVEFYTSRSICRIFKMKKIVREYLEDNGKQRTARYIAVVATSQMDTKYEAEKKKLEEYLVDNIVEEPEPTASTSMSDDEVPRKKMKFEWSDLENNIECLDVEMTSLISEVKVLDGCDGVKPFGTAKKPTLRQLTFANGILKVLKEHLCICGYQKINNLASQAVNETPMDMKSLKSFMQKLIIEGYIKVYKMKWPGLQKYTILICARHVRPTDPVIKAKYNEICVKVATNTHHKITKSDIKLTKSHLQYSYPRYLKIQNLHENIMRIAYFEYVKPRSHSLPQGFVSVLDLMPEVSIEFVINNITNMGIAEIKQLKITKRQLRMKLKQAPLPVYKTLMRSSSLHNRIRMNLNVLAMLGLIQLISAPATTITNTIKTSLIFYANRHAKILDTSGTWPRPHDETIEKSYYFLTPKNVENYWNDVVNISTSTTIVCNDRCKRKLLPPIRLDHERTVYVHDTGIRYGDGKGPCGFDSSFYMEIPRLWRTFHTRPIQNKRNSPKIITKHNIKEKKTKAKPKLPEPVKAETKKLFRRRPDVVVKWTRQEDMIITMCKAAITIMSPTAQPCCLIIRNVVAKELLSISDPKKTKAVCHSRAVALESNLSLTHEKQCIINELQRERLLIAKYENQLKRTRLHSTNMAKYIAKSKLPMLELVWLICQVMNRKSYTHKTQCVAMNVEEFHKNFTIEASTANKQCNLYKAPENAALKELIILIVMLSFHRGVTTDAAKQMYDVISTYPEANLRLAVDQLRKSGAISAKDKMLNNQVHRLDLEEHAQTSYKISAMYKRGWSNRLNSEFADNLANLLDEESCQKEFTGSPEINCSFFELQARDVIEIASATVPVITNTTGSMQIQEEMNAINIETNFRLKSGSLTWRNKCGSSLKKLSQFYSDINIENIMQYKGRSLLACENESQPEINSDDIISHLQMKAENGATVYEIEELLGCDHQILKKKITDLGSKNIVKVVGFNENIIVMQKYVEAWSTKIGDKYVTAYPWLNLDLNIRYDVFLNWTGSVLTKIFEAPGCPVTYISDKCEYLTCRSVLDICLFLTHCKCVKLSTVRSKKPDLFSNPDNEPEFDDYYQFAPPENILAFPENDCLTRYAYIRNMVLKNYVDDGELEAE